MGNSCCYKFTKMNYLLPPNVKNADRNQIPEIIVTQTTESLPDKPHYNTNDINIHNLNLKKVFDRTLSDDSGLHSPTNISEPSTPLSYSQEYSLLALENEKAEKRSSWIQVCGHYGSFILPPDVSEGTILKQYSITEASFYHEIQKEEKLKKFIPIFHNIVTDTITENKFIKIQDLLANYQTPDIMDCKMGCRTYLQEELDLTGKIFRNDLYQKMIKVDPNAPTPEEHEKKGILKTRYMLFRESLSSTTTLGFRVDGFKKSKMPKKTFPTYKTFDQVRDIFIEFTQHDQNLIKEYLKQVESLRQAILNSEFFFNQEIIGSSLLFIHDGRTLNSETAIIKMIDFARAQQSKSGKLSHSVFWEDGSHEDGYLIGIDNISLILKSMLF